MFDFDCFLIQNGSALSDKTVPDPAQMHKFQGSHKSGHLENLEKLGIFSHSLFLPNHFLGLSKTAGKNVKTWKSQGNLLKKL